MNRHDGHVAIVTGASRGIGLAIAQRLVAEGAKVCITARKTEALEDALQSLGGSDRAIAVPGSAADAAHQAQAITRTLDTFGSVDILVNNTGINPVYGPLLELDLAAGRKILEVNVLGSLAWIQQIHRAWMGSNGGAVINVASVAGMKPAEGIGFYGTSKAALIHMTQQLALELGPEIRVNAVAPAVVKTQFANVLYEGKEQEIASQYALKRLGTPDDIAGAVAFLGSADAAWITGQTLVVDGGLTLHGGV